MHRSLLPLLFISILLSFCPASNVAAASSDATVDLDKKQDFNRRLEGSMTQQEQMAFTLLRRIEPLLLYPRDQKNGCKWGPKKGNSRSIFCDAGEIPTAHGKALAKYFTRERIGAELVEKIEADGRRNDTGGFWVDTDFHHLVLHADVGCHRPRIIWRKDKPRMKFTVELDANFEYRSVTVMGVCVQQKEAELDQVNQWEDADKAQH